LTGIGGLVRSGVLMSARKPSTPVPEPCLLLDVGAAWLRAALVLEGRPLVIPFPSEGGRIPSCVGFDEGQLVLGDAARRLTITQPHAQVTRALRVAGLRHELAELEGGEWRQVPTARGRGGDVHFELGDERWPLPRLLGTLIQQLALQVERQREVRLARAFVSVAPGSDDARRRALVQVLHVAGFDDVTLIHSTTAAAIAWARLERDGAPALGFAALESMLAPSKPAAVSKPVEEDADEGEEKDEDEAADAPAEPESAEPEPEADAEQPEPPREQLTLLLDLGAGSFSAALVRLEGGSIEVLASRSRCDLGGDSIDERIVEWLLEHFAAEAEVDLSGDATVRARMRDVAEKAKIALSDSERYELRLPYLWADPAGPKHLFVALERDRFERMIKDIVAAVVELAQSVVADAGQDPNELDAIVMVGGVSRIPILQDRLESLFGRVPETELGNPALDEDFVVRGLALEAHRRGQRRPSTQVVEIAGRDVWLEREGAEPQRVVERDSPLPLRRSFDVTLIDGCHRAWLWEGDEKDRSRGPSLRLTLRSDREEVSLDLELDRNGEIMLASEAELRIDQRVGLSARALRRFRAEADERARIAAERDEHERLRRQVQELARLIEGWLTDPKVELDELLRTSLLAWNRDAEASFEHGDAALFNAAIEAFRGLAEALPSKLLKSFDASSLAPKVQPVAESENEGEVEEPLGDENEDYGEADEVAPFERAIDAEEPESPLSEPDQQPATAD
jgi:molecular chaperone DnaK (HSP70)